MPSKSRLRRRRPRRDWQKLRNSRLHSKISCREKLRPRQLLKPKRTKEELVKNGRKPRRKAATMIKKRERFD